MKFLDIASLSHLSSKLSEIDAGDSIVHGHLEAYSCKRAGSDTKLYKSLDKQYVEELSRSPSNSGGGSCGITTTTTNNNNNINNNNYSDLVSVSPFGPLTQSSSRMTLIFLIATLNASFPDYDFSHLRGEHFTKEPSIDLVINSIDTILSSVIPEYHSCLRRELWEALEVETQLRECDIYSYIPDPDSDPFFEDGYIWSFNYFFYNRKLRRVLFFTCRSVSKQTLEEEEEDFSEGEETMGFCFDEDSHGATNMEF